MTLKEFLELPIEKIIYLPNFHAVFIERNQLGKEAWRVVLTGEPKDNGTYTLFDREYPNELIAIFIAKTTDGPAPAPLIQLLN